MTKAFFEFSFFGFFIVFFPKIVSAQNIEIKPGQTLTYSINENNEKSVLNFKVTSVSPFWYVNWVKNNAFKDAGSLRIDTFATQNAVNLWFALSASSELIELTDVIPGFCLSKKMYKELIQKNKTVIRIDCNLKSEVLELKSKRKITLNYLNNTLEVEILLLSFGAFNDELWVINNPDLPLLVKWRGMNSWELKEITN